MGDIKVGTFTDRQCLTVAPPTESSRSEPRVEVQRKSGADAVIHTEKQGKESIKGREYPRQRLGNFQHIIISFLFQREKTIFNMNRQGGGGVGKGGKSGLSGETGAWPGSDGQGRDAECSAVTRGNSRSQNSCQAVT